MLNIELTLGQKLQVGFIFLVICSAGYFFFRNTRTNLDTSVNAWTVTRKYPVDLTKPLSQANPYDPKKEMTVNVFACYDGQMEITEYKNDPSKRPTIAWAKIDPRRKSYIYYIDPIAPSKAIKDPYRHALSLASYSAANNKPLGLLGACTLTKEQLDAEVAARKAMNDSLALLRMSIDNGGFRKDLMDLVMTAINDYRRTSGDPMKDAAKAAAIRKVLEAATNYLKAVEEEKATFVEKYIEKIDAVLTSEQHTKLADAAKLYEDRQVRVASGLPANPNPAPRPANPQATPRGNNPTTRPTNARGRANAAANNAGTPAIVRTPNIEAAR